MALSTKLVHSVRTKRRLIQWLGLILTWMIVAALEALYLYAVSFDGIWLQVGPFFHFRAYLFTNLVSAFVAGVIGGGFFLFYLREALSRKTFWVALVINSGIIIIVNMALSGLSFALLNSFRLNRIVIDPEVWEGVGMHYTSAMYLKNLGFWSLVVVLTIIVLRVNDKYGPGLFVKQLLGRYHRPKEEDRIFMFLDLRSSTAIAENIGHINYFYLLRDFFRDITPAIMNTEGEIYQYVGDEVVVSWEVKRGIRRSNCLRCYFAISESIARKAHIYQHKYGLVPEFKAGFHGGTVTAGEIGKIKKEIVYTGDVLNTTARIQSKCNKYGVKILLSKELLDHLALPPDVYEVEKIGDIKLKGKDERVVLYTVLNGEEGIA